MNYRGHNALPFVAGLLVLFIGLFAGPLSIVVMIIGLFMAGYGFYLLLKSNPTHQQVMRDIESPIVTGRARRID